MASIQVTRKQWGEFYIPILFAFNNLFGLKGLIFAQPTADLLALILSIIVSCSIIKKNKASLRPKEGVCDDLASGTIHY
jgi:Na+-driven multidrug efflux pump